MKIVQIKQVARLLGLLAVVFSGEVGAMRMSPAGAQRAKALLAEQNRLKSGLQVPSKTQQIKTDEQKKQELKEAFSSDTDYAVVQKAKTLKPGEYFVHAKGTADGIVVTRNVLEKSLVLKSMLENTTWQQDQATIPLPFSVDMITLVFDALNRGIVPERMSLQDVFVMEKLVDYLDIPSLYLSPKDKKEKLLNYSLEDLVALFNKLYSEKNPEQKVVAEVIMVWFNDIVYTAEYFTNELSARRIGVPEDIAQKVNYVKSHMTIGFQRAKAHSFIDYKGQMVQMFPGMDLLIPNYKSLANIEEEAERLLKDQNIFKLQKSVLEAVKGIVYNLLLESYVRQPFIVDKKTDKELYKYTPNELLEYFYGKHKMVELEELENYFKQSRMVDFLDVIFKRIADEYNKRISLFSVQKKSLRLLYEFFAK